MKSPIDILKDVYRIVKSSNISSTITGDVSYLGRRTDREDCCISIQDGKLAEMQEANVYVRLYVHNIVNGNKSVMNIARLDELAKICDDVLAVGFGDSFRFECVSRIISEVNGKDEHVIANKLVYRNFNCTFPRDYILATEDDYALVAESIDDNRILVL